MSSRRSAASPGGAPMRLPAISPAAGAEANNTAVLMALTAACPAFSERGARAFAGWPRLYVSAESHLAWFKIAHQAGIGREAVRLVPTDGTGKLDPRALEQLIRTDRADGGVPVFIGATAGTTNAGMIDPLDACFAISRAHGAWFHVDAAWGGAGLVSPALRRTPARHRKGRFDHARCAQMVRGSDGRRHVSCAGTMTCSARPSAWPPATCRRARRPGSIPIPIPSNGRGGSWA